MKVRFETKPAFKVAGYMVGNAQDENLTALWEKLFITFKMEQLLSLGDGRSYGSCFDYQQPHSFSYIAGFDVDDLKKAEALGLQVLDVPEAEYAIFELTGPVPNNIEEGWKFAMGEYLPAHGMRHAGTPDFEYYFDGDVDAPDYKMELWVPIVRME